MKFRQLRLGEEYQSGEADDRIKMTVFSIQWDIPVFGNIPCSLFAIRRNLTEWFLTFSEVF